MSKFHEGQGLDGRHPGGSYSGRRFRELLGKRLPEQEAYVTVDALKNLMTTMTDTILQ